MRSSFWRVLWLTSVSILCAVASRAEKLTLHGVVIDAQSSRPLAGAVVSVAGGLGRCDVLSDEEGTFVLPLIDAVRAGQLIRVRAEAAGYKPQDIQLAASNEPVTTIKLRRVSARSAARVRPMIEQVLILDGTANAIKVLEIQIANKTANPVFFQKLQVRGDYVIGMAGMTVFLSRVDYDVSLEAFRGDEIKGTAQATSARGPGYEISGYYSATFSSEEQSWRGGISANCPIRIDANDKLLLRLNLQKPAVVLRDKTERGHFMSAIGTKLLRDALEVRLTADNGDVIAWTGSDSRQFLGWLSEGLPEDDAE